MDAKDIEVPMEKNLHARSAGNRKTEKLSIPALNRVEKTSVSITSMASGLNRDHRKPRTEFRYLSLNSLTVRFRTSSAYWNSC
jgi:hypothetical protein